MTQWIAGMMQALPGLTLAQIVVEMNAVQVQTLARGLAQLQYREQEEMRRWNKDAR